MKPYQRSPAIAPPRGAFFVRHASADTAGDPAADPDPRKSRPGSVRFPRPAQPPVFHASSSYKSPGLRKKEAEAAKARSAHHSQAGASSSHSRANSLQHLLRDTGCESAAQQLEKPAPGLCGKARKSLFRFNDAFIKPAIVSASAKRLPGKGRDLGPPEQVPKARTEAEVRPRGADCRDREVANVSERARLYNFLLNNYVTNLVIEKSGSDAQKEDLLYERT